MILSVELILSYKPSMVREKKCTNRQKSSVSRLIRPKSLKCYQFSAKSKQTYKRRMYQKGLTIYRKMRDSLGYKNQIGIFLENYPNGLYFEKVDVCHVNCADALFQKTYYSACWDSQLLSNSASTFQVRHCNTVYEFTYVHLTTNVSYSTAFSI